jgi:hypothetical protein
MKAYNPVVNSRDERKTKQREATLNTRCWKPYEHIRVIRLTLKREESLGDNARKHQILDVTHNLHQQPARSSYPRPNG